MTLDIRLHVLVLICELCGKVNLWRQKGKQEDHTEPLYYFKQVASKAQIEW